MDEYQELIKTAQVLKTVKVDGDFWLVMQACVNSILSVAENIKKEVKQNDTIDNNA